MIQSTEPSGKNRPAAHRYQSSRARSGIRRWLLLYRPSRNRAWPHRFLFYFLTFFVLPVLSLAALGAYLGPDQTFGGPGRTVRSVSGHHRSHIRIPRRRDAWKVRDIRKGVSHQRHLAFPAGGTASPAPAAGPPSVVQRNCPYRDWPRRCRIGRERCGLADPAGLGRSPGRGTTRGRDDNPRNSGDRHRRPDEHSRCQQRNGAARSRPPPPGARRALSPSTAGRAARVTAAFI